MSGFLVLIVMSEGLLVPGGNQDGESKLFSRRGTHCRVREHKSTLCHLLEEHQKPYVGIAGSAWLFSILCVGGVSSTTPIPMLHGHVLQNLRRKPPLQLIILQPVVGIGQATCGSCWRRIMYHPLQTNGTEHVQNYADMFQKPPGHAPFLPHHSNLGLGRAGVSKLSNFQTSTSRSSQPTLPAEEFWELLSPQVLKVAKHGDP